MKKLILTAIALSTLIAFITKLTHSTKNEENTLSIGTNAEYPPYAFIDQGKIQGFDIDVAKEVCKRLGKSALLKDMPFEALIPSLQMEKFDFIAAGITPTEERAKKVLFTKSYTSDAPYVVLSPNSSPINDTSQLQGKKLIVNQGYTVDKFLSEMGGVDVIRLASPAEALMALHAKRADGFVTSKNSVEDFLKKKSGANFKITPIDYSSDGCSLAFSLNNTTLQKQVSEALEEMEQDGILGTLRDKWGLY